MNALTDRILKFSTLLPEGRPISAKELLHFANRAAIDQALSRLVQRGKLIRSGRGLYVRPVQTRFGARAPSPEQVVAEVARLRGEVIAPHGAVSANAFGLSTQVPLRLIYLTSGRSRRLHLGAQTVELQRAPSWQLTNPDRESGAVIRTLAWAGSEQAHVVLNRIKPRLARETREELLALRAIVPGWLAKTISLALST